MGDWRLDLIRRSYEAFGSGDREGILDLYDPECDWDMGEWSGALGQDFHGHGGLLRVNDIPKDVFSDWAPVLKEVRLRPDGAVLVRGAGSGTSEHFGEMVAPDFGQVIHFRARRILRVVQTAFPPEGWEDAEPLR